MNHFICPICKKNLKKESKSLICFNRHCFDLAKEGYVNLLPIKSKKSKDPGDNLKMMTARRMFLEQGHYIPLADKLLSIITSITGDVNKVALDIGCGEGYYTGLLKESNKSVDLMGLDISKSAVKYASKKYKDVSFCVASAFDLPVGDSTIDIIFRIFAPSSNSELQRVIKPGGYFVAVTPGKRHLYQLRNIIYSDVHSELNEPDIPEGFEIQDRYNVNYSLSLKDFETVMLLLDMTPFGWKVGKNEKDQLHHMSTYNIDCDFNIDVFKNILAYDP